MLIVLACKDSYMYAQNGYGSRPFHWLIFFVEKVKFKQEDMYEKFPTCRSIRSICNGVSKHLGKLILKGLTFLCKKLVRIERTLAEIATY